MRPWLLFVLISAGAGEAAAQAGWRRIDDAPPAGRADSLPQFTAMPPGFHATTWGTGAIYFDSSATARGRFVIESSQFLFPGTSASGYGVFLGGSGLDTPSRASYTAFLMRRNGDIAVEMRKGGAVTRVVAWTPASSIRAASADSAVSNTLRVVVERDSIGLEVNGVRTLNIARAGLPIDGVFGLRVGSGMNLHITTLDHLRRLAPVPVRQEPR